MKPTCLRLIAARKTRAVWMTAMLSVLAAISVAGQAASPWQQPAAALAAKIADLLGPGPARVTIRNASSIPTDQIPAIRKLLEQDLKARGVTAGGTDSANTASVTLSENTRERLWVAQIVDGNETRVAMVSLPAAAANTAKPAGALVLRRQQWLVAKNPALAVLELPGGVVTLEPERIAIYTHAANEWQEQQHAELGIARSLGRDTRGALLGTTGGTNFEAWLPGVACAGRIDSLTVQCHESDDPWAVTQPPLQLTSANASASSADVSVEPVRAFYNAGRDYFTGVVAPSPGPDLPPFYSLAVVPRSAGTAAILIGGVDGKVQMAENGALHTVAGTRDWGSDFAVLQSSCGAGAQVIASGSGDAATDSLRAYELSGYEAVPVSELLEIAGTVMSLETAPDQKSVLAIVRNAANQYEVDRVTALCN